MSYRHIKHELHEESNSVVTENMMCAEENGRAEDACQGDSGGPLIMHTDSGDYQVGVVSWGIGCAHDDFPGVYARVSSQYNWIRDEVCKRSSAPPSYLQCGTTVDGDNVEFAAAAAAAAPSSGASNAGAENANAQGNNAQVADEVSHPGAKAMLVMMLTLMMLMLLLQFPHLRMLLILAFTKTILQH